MQLRSALHFCSSLPIIRTPPSAHVVPDQPRRVFQLVFLTFEQGPGRYVGSCIVAGFRLCVTDACARANWDSLSCKLVDGDVGMGDDGCAGLGRRLRLLLGYLASSPASTSQPGLREAKRSSVLLFSVQVVCRPGLFVVILSAFWSCYFSGELDLSVKQLILGLLSRTSLATSTLGGLY